MTICSFMPLRIRDQNVTKRLGQRVLEFSPSKFPGAQRRTMVPCVIAMVEKFPQHSNYIPTGISLTRQITHSERIAHENCFVVTPPFVAVAPIAHGMPLALRSGMCPVRTSAKPRRHLRAPRP